MNPLGPETAFELCKVILQLVYADLEVAPEEVAYVHRLAEQLQLDQPHRDAIDAWLGGAAPLPPPDLGRLQSVRSEVLRAAAGLVAADGRVVEDERDVLHELARMLQ